jgi:probable F420-dependent oxidoreductase
MTPFFNPGPIRHPEIPIFIGGLNPYMCRLAGELCQGMHIHPLHSVKFIREAIMPGIKEGADKAGRDSREVSLSTAAFVATGSDRGAVEKAKEKIRSQIAFYSSTRNYFPVLEMHGWGDTARALQKKSIAGDWEGMPQEISDEMLNEFAIIGTYPELAEKIQKKYDGVIDRLSLYDCVPTPGEEKEWRPIIKAING